MRPDYSDSKAKLELNGHSLQAHRLPTFQNGSKPLFDSARYSFERWKSVCLAPPFPGRRSKPYYAKLATS